MGSEKMSKSLGNVKLIHDLLKEWDGEVIRLALLKAHYRSELVWTEDLLKESKAQLDAWYRVLLSNNEVLPLSSCGPDNSVHFKKIFNDIGANELVAYISRLCKNFDASEKNKPEKKVRVLHATSLIGLLQKDPEAWFKGGASADEEAEFDAIALRRQEARAAKNWAAADAARDEATAKGIVLEDGPDGTTWRKA